MTLTEFLLARLDEDQALAQASYDAATDFKVLGPPVAEYHINNWKPARVLAEVDAKRRIVEWCSERELIDIRTISSPEPPRPEDFVPGRFTHATDAVVLRWLALPYADHPDYDESWRP